MDKRTKSLIVGTLGSLPLAAGAAVAGPPTFLPAVQCDGSVRTMSFADGSVLPSPALRVTQAGVASSTGFACKVGGSVGSGPVSGDSFAIDFGDVVFGGGKSVTEEWKFSDSSAVDVKLDPAGDAVSGREFSFSMAHWKFDATGAGQVENFDMFTVKLAWDPTLYGQAKVKGDLAFNVVLDGNHLTFDPRLPDVPVNVSLAAEVAPVPLPGAAVLLGSALAGGVLRRRRRTA